MKITKLLFFVLILPCRLLFAETITVTPENQKIDIYGNLYFYEDKTGSLTVDDIYSIRFDKFQNKHKGINEGHSRSTFWYKFTIKNTLKDKVYYILAVENPNLDEVDMYEYYNGLLTKRMISGESKSMDTREFRHRNFLFKSQLKTEGEYTYFIRLLNNGDELTAPIVYEQTEPYFIKDEKQLITLGLFNGLFFMISLFTLYLYIRLRDLVYLYYSLYVLLTTLFVLGGDGLSAFIFPPYIVVRIKLTFIHFGMFFLILFTQSFYKSSKDDSFHFPWYFNSLKVITIIGAFLTFLPYPYRLSSIYTGTIISPVIFITVILVSLILYKKEYYTSFYTAAFFFSLTAVIIYILYDYGIMGSSVLTNNSLRIGKTFEGILLTLAVVERFKYNENQDKIQLKNNSEKIESQKETLQDINHELEKLSIVASETDNAIAIFDSNYDIEWCNSAFERMYEISFSDIIQEYGKNILQLSNHNDIKHIVNECIDSKQSVRYQSKRKLNNEKEYWTQTTLTPYLNNVGELVKLISIDTNITQLKEVQKQLIQSRDKAEESDKLKSAFLSNISHEIRTPLNAILGFTELLLIDRGDAIKRKKYLELVRNNGRHLLKLISDIIDISRVEAGEINLDLFKGNINALLKEIYDHYSIEIESNLTKDVKFKHTFALKDEESEVFADHHKIRQVITNLINNALKFTLTGQVEIGYEVKGKFFHFYVKDTGIGIEEEQQRVIFERFRQVELGLSRKYEGAGLGLSLSKGLVEKMGGTIMVKSKIGKGSTFSFNVPYEPIKLTEVSKDEEPEKEYNFKGKHFLLVEDTASSRELVHEMLEDTGAEITDAVDGKQALILIKDAKFDAILMDIRLPDINGYEVTRMIRKIDKGVYIIAQTANAMDDEKNKCFEAGCNDYLSKPFDSDSLLDLIDKNIKVRSI